MTKCTRPKEIFYHGNKGPLRETFNYSSAGYVIADKQSKILFKSLRMLTNFRTSNIILVPYPLHMSWHIVILQHITVWYVTQSSVMLWQH